MQINRNKEPHETSNAQEVHKKQEAQAGKQAGGQDPANESERLRQSADKFNQGLHKTSAGHETQQQERHVEDVKKTINAEALRRDLEKQVKA